VASCVTVLVALFAAAVPRAVASSMRLLVPHAVAFASDGQRYVAWQVSQGPHMVVLDTGTGRRQYLTLPAGCDELEQEAAGGEKQYSTAFAGSFLIGCGGYPPQDVIYNVVSHSVVRLPPEASWWYALGSRYAAGFIEENVPKNRVLYDLSNGEVSYHGEHEPLDGAFDEPLALEQPGAAVTDVCSSVRRILNGGGGLEPLAVNPDAHAYLDGMFAQRARPDGDVQLDLCGGRRKILHGRGGSGLCREEPADFDLRGGVLTWDTGCHDLGYVESPNRYARLYSYDLSSHERRSWQLPRRHVANLEAESQHGYSTHTANAVFWIAVRTVGEDEHGGPYVDTTAVYIASR
jgi:hypothetical protein